MTVVDATTTTDPVRERDPISVVPLLAVVAPAGADLAPMATATGRRLEVVPAGGLRDSTAELVLVITDTPPDPSLVAEALTLVLDDLACGCVTVTDRSVLFRRCALEAAQGLIERDLAAAAPAVVDRVERLGWRVWEADEPT